jgi:hypothetical protein
MDDINPYASRSYVGSARDERTAPTLAYGPVIPIAIGLLLGGVSGVPFLMIYSDNLAGFLTLVPGAILGGLFYRHFDVDIRARYKGFINALMAFMIPTTVVAMMTGLRAQGLAITILAGIMGGSFALGILAAGSRRPQTTG